MKTQWKNRCIAIWTALFVLHAPLCTLACVASSSAAETPPTVSAAAHESMPCHQQAPNSTPTSTAREGAAESRSGSAAAARGSLPTAPAGSPTECGCDGDETAVLVQAEQEAQPLEPLAGIPHDTLLQELPIEGGWTRLVPAEETDLPPPDILLLNATFLI